ncbi:A-kinase anchor protein 17A [Hemibagrus wyckioides]|uniref:A-kinase anchor protein 17A n=1 Tax=Hemibagrus wyckioides TaxID=337641 RepID=UPI00266C834A|nr:A-kinase anchor protein 17A [Hemibagrus wyckioides]XP_058249259.1 A-kinase anchor protein 17A [Hemibagrus wyckioides]
MTTIVHDASESVLLCREYNLYMKPIAKMTISVSLPQLKLPGKSISNWEVMERLKSMVHPEQFSSLRISKSTMDYIRFEGEAENKSAVKRFLTNLDGKSIKLSGFTDVLKVRAAETKMDFPTRHDWDSFFRDAKDMNETVPGERPDTVHLEGLPCKWFAPKDTSSDKPSEDVLKCVFEKFGKIRNVDIPMLDPYREEMTGKNFNTFSFGGHLNFESYVQYEDHTGFVKAMSSLRGMKLLYKGEDGKAMACGIKVSFDTTKHLSDSSLKKRHQERLKLQELERQREEQKRREKEEEERRREEERKQRELEEEEKEKRREEKLRKREQKLKEREEKKNQKKVKKQQEEEQKKLHQKIAMEERKLLLVQRNLQSIRLIAELLSRAKAMRQQQLEQEKAELARLHKEAEIQRQQEAELRRKQEAELRRVEGEKARALELQRKERELRDRLLENLLKKSTNQEAGSNGEDQKWEGPSTEPPQMEEPNRIGTTVTRDHHQSKSRKEEERGTSREWNRGSGRSRTRSRSGQRRSRNRRYRNGHSQSRSGSGQRRSRRSGHGRSLSRSRSRRRHSRDRRGHRRSGRSHRYSHGWSSSSSSSGRSMSRSSSRGRSRRSKRH